MEYKIDVLKVAQFPETPGSEILLDVQFWG